MSAMKTEPLLLGWTDSDPSPTSAGVSPIVWVGQAEWLNRIVQQIQNLDRLQPNWDSYGAAPISAKSILEALRVAEGISWYDDIEAPDISATPDGFVAFGWGLGDWSLDADIEPDGQIVYAFLDRFDEDLGHDGVLSHWSQLADILCQAFESRRLK